MNERLHFMQEAVKLAENGMNNNEGGPFGCVIVKDGRIIGKGNNRVTSTNDPTAHAEVVAIRDACKNLNEYQLEGCEIYTSCEPCPMCMGAIYWARPSRVFYALTREDAAAIGFDDSMIYEELKLPLDARKIPIENCAREESLHLFHAWKEKQDKNLY
jgi:guanine deaminase